VKIKISIIIALAMASTSPASADMVVNDDLIVQGKLCLNIDCVNDQVFGTETILLRANNTRTTFIDSTAEAGAQSWRLVANDNTSGGRDNFQFQVKPDLTATETGTPIIYFATAGNGAIALGSGSEIVDGEVSVGALTLERRIVNVARALADTDLATVADLASVGDNANDRLDAVEAQLNDIQSVNLLLDSIDTQLDEIEDIIRIAETSKLVRSGGGSINPFMLLVFLGCFSLFRLRNSLSGDGGLR
jgi:hypothetical protein